MGGVLYTRGARAAGDGDPGLVDDGRRRLECGAPRCRPRTIGVAPESVEGTYPAWQSIGGPAIAALPWTPDRASRSGLPAPTPSPSPVPDLAPGFTWAGAPTTTEGGPLGETATKLEDGRVLLTQGCGTAAELYDPSTGSFTPTGSMSVNRAGKTATLLQDGRVLMAGGYDCGRGGEDGIWATAEIYDPSDRHLQPTGSMHTGRGVPYRDAAGRWPRPDRRWLHGATAVAGCRRPHHPGVHPDRRQRRQRARDRGDLRPGHGHVQQDGSMTTFRDQHTATLLEDGRVLVIGGGGEGYASKKSADVYDPATGTFSKTGSLKTGRWLHTATLLHDGRVLVTRWPLAAGLGLQERRDLRPGDGAGSASAGSMGEGRQQHTATLAARWTRPDRRRLLERGKNWRVLSSTEMFDPATGAFSPTGSMGARPRRAHRHALDDGRVFIVGGGDIGRDGGVGGRLGGAVPAVGRRRPARHARGGVPVDIPLGRIAAAAPVTLIAPERIPTMPLGRICGRVASTTGGPFAPATTACP